MGPQKKKVRIVNQEKEARRHEKKKLANDGISKARKALEDTRETKAQREARRKQLQDSLAAASEEQAKAAKMEIDTIENELQQTEQRLREVEAEEAKFKKDEEDADNEDVHEEMEVIFDDGGNDPDKPKPSTESMDPAEFAAKLMTGLSISDRKEGIDLTQDIQLRNTQAVVCYKSGFGKPVIVVDCEIPNFPIYRIRKDIMVPDRTPNLMRWRRGGKWKDVKAEVKWRSRDIKDILGIAIEVPLGYNGKPEDLVQPIRRLSKKEKEKLIKKGKPIPKEPKQPDVQLIVEWWQGVIPEGETEKRYTSLESRSSCRDIWRKKGVADAFLLDVATKKEAGYRRAGGRHSSEERSLSPIRIPRGTPGVDDDLNSDEPGTEDEEEEEEQKKKKKERKKGKKEEEGEEEEGEEEEGEEEEDEEEEDEEEEDEEEKKEQKKKEQKKKEQKKEQKKKKKKEEEEKKKEEEEKKKKGEEKKDEASVYEASLKAFEPKFRIIERIEAGAKLTAAQKGEMIEAFDAYWERQQAK
ncbi:hypothetical protein BDZ45DRAFT_694662 [Acephala macrosclerotiorum]|nr:hypothetical protein BDZ45DRAFT_694662 [Acephala macrosclerotiorum]